MVKVMLDHYKRDTTIRILRAIKLGFSYAADISKITGYSDSRLVIGRECHHLVSEGLLNEIRGKKIINYTLTVYGRCVLILGEKYKEEIEKIKQIEKEYRYLQNKNRYLQNSHKVKE